MLAFVFIFFTSTYAQQHCSIVTNVQEIYPTIGELYTLELNYIFQGLNLSFTCKDCPIQLYNYLNLLDQQSLNFTTISIVPQYNNPLLLFLQQSSYGIYNISTSEISTYIYQSEYTLQCFSITIFGLVDCYNNINNTFVYFNSRGYPIFNQPIEITPKYTKMDYYKSLLFQAIFDDISAVIYIFQSENGLPTQLLNTFVSQGEITDFCIADNGTIYILNRTTSFSTYNIQNNGTLSFIRKHELTLKSSALQQLALNLIKSQSNNNEWYLYVVTSREYLNVNELFIAENMTFPGRKFNSPHLDIATPIQIHLSPKYMILAQGIQQSYYHLGPLMYNQTILEGEIKDFFYSTNGTEQYFILNPETNIFKAASTELVTVQLGQAKLRGISNQAENGTLQLKAVSIINGKSKDCKFKLNYRVLTLNDTNIYMGYQGSNLPETSLYPRNLSFNINQMFSGPLINAQGIVHNDSQSSIITTTIFNLNVSNQIFPKFVTYSQSLYIELSTSLLLLMVSNNQIFGYLCEISISFQCANIFVNENPVEYITQIEIGLLDSLGNNFVYVYNQGKSKVVAYQIQYINSTFSQTFLGMVILSLGEIEVNINQFSLVNDKLYVVINQQILIWNVLDLPTNVYPFRRITSLDFDFNFAFFPQQIATNYKYFGQTLFINNLNTFLIIQYSQEQLQIFSITDYIFQNMGAQINLVGKYLVATQYPYISQWEIVTLMNPLFIKQFPIITQLDINWLVMSDDIFIYYRQINGNISIYNPYLQYHSCLYQNQYINSTYISPTSSREYSVIVYGNASVTKIMPYNSLVFIPGYYSIAYVYNTSYNIIVSNQIGNNSFNITQNMSILNSQLGIELNQSEFALNNQLIISHSGFNVFQLNLTQVSSGDIASYTLYCNFCDNNTIIYLINSLQRQRKNKIGGLTQVQQIINYPLQSSLLAQTLESIYMITPQINQSVLLYNFSTTFVECTSLSLDLENIVSVCIIPADRVVQLLQIFQYSNKTLTLLFSSQLDDITQVNKASFLGDLLFIQGIKGEFSLFYTLFVYRIKNESLSFYTSFSCSYGIIDYSYTPLYNYTLNDTLYIQFAIFYTCNSPNEVYYFNGLLFNQTFTISDVELEISELQDFTFFSDTNFLQIVPIKIDPPYVILLLTMNNVMNLIIQLSYNQTQYSKFEPILLTYDLLLTTIPPYGDFKLVNRASYTNGWLVLTFYMISDTTLQSFISVYNLTKPFIKNQPLLMIGGLTQEIMELKRQSLIIMPPNSNSNTALIIYTDSMTNLSLGQIVVQPNIQLVVNSTQPFGTKQLIMFAENYYTKQQLVFEVEYPIPIQSSLVPWWTWLIVLVALVLGGVCVTVVWVRCKNEENEYSELEL